MNKSKIDNFLFPWLFWIVAGIGTITMILGFIILQKELYETLPAYLITYGLVTALGSTILIIFDTDPND